jgi:hypothetical protein
MNDLTIPRANNDWDDGDGRSSSSVRGSLLKFVDGRWSVKGGTTIPPKLLAVSTRTLLQCWKDAKPISTISEYPLPDVDELNAKIPESKWEVDKFNSDKRVPPWRKYWAVYMLDPATMNRFTYINSTNGARQAVDDLRDAVRMMHAVRGSNLLPVVELSSKIMHTQYGEKARPEFRITSWTMFADDTAAQLEDKGATVAEAMKTVEALTTEEVLNDELPF